MIIYIVISIINLNINVKYIKNFMNLINIDFEREKNDIKWNIIMIIYSILFLFCLILIIIFRVNPEISGMDKFALQEEFVENVIKEIDQKIVMD